MKKQDKCKTCKHFMSRQRDLNYHSGIGFCANNKFNFNTIDGTLVGIYDTENKKDINKVSGNPSHNFESAKDGFGLNQSRYRLTVSEAFGCLYHQP